MCVCITVDVCWAVCVDVGVHECVHMFMSVCVCVYTGVCGCVACFPFRRTPKVIEASSLHGNHSHRACIFNPE